MRKQKTQTFNDGIVNIYSVGNIAEIGNKPKEDLTLKADSLRYEERTVGMGRFWTAKQSQAQIDLIIRTPQRREISTQDIAIPIDGQQYKIKQVQYPPDVHPPSMDLSLERLEAAYDIS
ncbi:phage head-tail joining protein [Clostridium aceticum]|uniref:Phage head-tail joining protein n=1 Tax=Clostridium aceticum TaxID=84022 RepID=A0A0D8I708_9CLOT|nr:head-tail adaptor protein [Clostridium aceticum]AKL96626.1 phage head-tail joining protein [Clostridium aceticum]KJF26070.1 hypothetical protein TZ02_15220 [Clostridium aceticum]